MTHAAKTTIKIVEIKIVEKKIFEIEIQRLLIFDFISMVSS